MISARHLFSSIALLWLCGAALRLTILAVPPVLPRISADLGLSATEVGILSSLPVVLFAIAALPASLLIARLGGRSTLIWGLLLVCIGSALRGVTWDAATLYGATIVMGAGVALMQPAMPTVVRQWLPSRVSFGTAVYSNGLLISEIVPVAMALSVVMPLVGQSWRLQLAVWSVPVALILVLVLIFAPKRPAQPLNSAHSVVWWPDWRDGSIWKLGLLFGSVNATYFATNAFLPPYLASIGHGDQITAALTALNLGQLPASLMMLAVARKVELRASPYFFASVIWAVSVIGLVSMPGAWIIIWASLLGFAGAATLILALTLPPLLSRQEHVGRNAAAMFTISYSMSVAIAVACGIAWDISGSPSSAFIPIGLCALFLAIAAAALKSDGRLS